MSITTSSSPTSVLPSVRRLLRRLHLWVGLALVLPAVALGLSGTLLLLEPDADGSAGELNVQLAGVVYAARQASGIDQSDIMIRAPKNTSDSIQVRLGQGSAASSFSVDPVTLAAVPASRTGWQILHDLHGNFLAGRTGRTIVGWTGGSLLLLVISGAFLWWPAPGRLIAALTPRFSGGAYRVLRNLHPVMGAVMSLVLVVMMATGFNLALLSGGPQSGAFSRTDHTGSDGPPLDADQILAAARTAAKTGPWVVIILPKMPQQQARVTFASGEREPGGLITVTLNAVTGHVISLRDSRKSDSGSGMPVILRRVHEAEGFGIVWRFLAILSGVAMAGLAVSGAASWGLRLTRRKSEE